MFLHRNKWISRDLTENRVISRKIAFRGEAGHAMRSLLGFPCSAIGTFSNKLKGKRSHFAIHFKQKGFLGDNSTYLPSILMSSYLL